mmetsp:Transcript_1800/g.2216  ORF Transcript_1800/g.2216 Transcript_1800/m.2216 type:complete len:80 (+) Transcript_1800:1058-1297(+)
MSPPQECRGNRAVVGPDRRAAARGLARNRVPGGMRDVEDSRKNGKINDDKSGQSMDANTSSPDRTPHHITTNDPRTQSP